MATFSKLQSRFNELKNQETEYWGHLRESLDGIVEQVGKLLALPTPRALRLGVTNESGEFESLHPSVIPQKFRSLAFSIQLVLSEEKSEAPPSILSTDWALWREKGVVKLSGGEGDAAVKSFDEAAMIIINELSRVLESSDPSKTHNFF